MKALENVMLPDTFPNLGNESVVVVASISATYRSCPITARFSKLRVVISDDKKVSRRLPVISTKSLALTRCRSLHTTMVAVNAVTSP